MMIRFLSFTFLVAALLAGFSCTREPDSPAPIVTLTYVIQPQFKEITIYNTSPVRLRFEAKAEAGIDSVTVKVYQDSLAQPFSPQGFPLSKVGANDIGTDIARDFTVGIDTAYGDALVSVRVYDKKGRNTSASFRVRVRKSPYRVIRRTIRIFGQDTIGGGNVGNFYSFSSNRVSTYSVFSGNPAIYDFAYGALNVGLRTFISPSRYGQETAPISAAAVTGARITRFRATTLNLDGEAFFDPSIGDEVMKAPLGDDLFFYSVSDENANFIMFLNNGKRILVDVKTPIDTRLPLSKRFLDLTLLMVEPR